MINVNKFLTLICFYKFKTGKSSIAEKNAFLELAKNFTTQQSDGVPYKTRLQIGGVYFISTNIDVGDGLFNGATGVLKKIELADGVPKRAWMEFNHPSIGLNKRKITESYQKTQGIDDKWVAVDKIEKKLTKYGQFAGLSIVRQQIPLVAANGMTVNKAQGSSMDFVVVPMPSGNRRKILTKN